jgi:rare lipoprotein A
MSLTKPLLPALLLALLVGCASRAPAPAPGSRPTPPVGGWPDKDGPDAVIPPDLHKVPDAAPKLENIRKGGPNKPYEVLGQRYEPVADDQPLVERGLASWYGKKFHGRPTASGEVYNMYAMTAAHPTMPIPSYARVRNPKNGREVIVRINDRGPFHKGRIIDLSYTAALKLDVLRGVAPIEVERLTYEDIRTGAWMRGSEPGSTPAVDPAPVYTAGEASGAPALSSTATAAAAVDPAALLAEDNNAPVPQIRSVAAPGFWLQLGAFSQLDGAEAFRQKLLKEADWMAPLLAVFKERNLHRLQAGPYASREDARQAAARVREALALQPVVVERR